MAARKQAGERKARRPKGPLSQDARVLRMLRASRGFDQGELNVRARLPNGRVGKYERDDSNLTTEDLRRILEGLDYPDRAWTETTAHLRRLNYLRSEHVRRGGTSDQIVDRDPDPDLASWIVDRDSRPDPEAIRQERQRISETAGRYVEELLNDALGLLTRLVGRDPDSTG